MKLITSEENIISAQQLPSCVPLFFVFSSKKWFWRGFYPECSYVISVLCFFFTGNFTRLCCCKYCKNVIRDKKFLQSRLFCLFFMPFMQVLTWNIRRFLSLGPESFISSNIRNFLRVSSFYFSSSESCFLKYKEVFRFPKHKKKLSLEEI